jgi:cytochrome c biogenesis protein CcdA
MVATTAAAVRGGRIESPARAAAWHLAGLMLGAAGLGVGLAAMGAAVPLPRGTMTVILGMLALLAGTGAALGRSIPVPSSGAQVPEAWSVTMSPAQYTFAYGVGLGLGVLTRVPSWSLYLFLGVLVLVGDPAVALVAAPVYGLARGLPVLAASRSDRSSPEIVEAMERFRPLAFRTDGLIMALIGATLILGSL